MKKGEFNEVSFSHALEEIKARHNRLTLTVPTSGSFVCGEEPAWAPDLIFQDAESGKKWIVEIKFSGTEVVSPSVVPQLYSYRKTYGGPPKTEIVLLTNSSVPDFVSEQLRKIGVRIIAADDQNNMVQKLEEIIDEEQTAQQ